MNKYYIVYNLSNKIASAAGHNLLIKFFNELEILSSLKESISQRINNNSDFEINVSELQEIVPALSEKINNLLSAPDFNPFKEREREEYPAAYNKFPFIWNGVTYYLYPKDNDIDSEINRTNGYLKLIQEFINQNKPLKYIYKSS